MKHYLIFFLILFGPLIGQDPFLFNKDNTHIEVNNRVLACVNAKAITVIDVMKKMDMLFFKHFPEYASSPQARFQYYQMNWKPVLQELIDKELILADAEENKIPLTPGDVRQEMEMLFGPNIIANLDKIGLSFDEAFKIVQGDLLLKRTMMVRVNSKAIRSVTPQLIREAYNEFAKKNINKERWNYQVVTIRNADPTLGAETATLSYQLLTDKQIKLDKLLPSIDEMNATNSSVLSVSEPILHSESDMAEIIKNNLLSMSSGSISRPIAQKSRTDKSTIFRILVLNEKILAGAVPFKEVENQIKNELFDKAIQRDSEIYLKKLRDHYAISENYISETVPSDFQPFSLKSL